MICKFLNVTNNEKSYDRKTMVYNGRHFRNILMKFKIDHIGYVVKNLNNTLKYYKNNYNFIPITKIIIEKAHGVKLIFLDLGTSSVQL